MPRRPRGGVLLWHRDFRLLWVGETVSHFGSEITLVALPLVAVTTLHASAFEVGALTALVSARSSSSGFPPAPGATGCAAGPS